MRFVFESIKDLKSELPKMIGALKDGQFKEQLRAALAEKTGAITPSIPEPVPVPQAEALPEGWTAPTEPTPFDTTPVQTQTQPAQQAPATTPATTQAVSFEEVTQAAIKLMDAGKQDALRGLLQKFGVPALPALKDDQEKLTAFYAELGGL